MSVRGGEFGPHNQDSDQDSSYETVAEAIDQLADEGFELLVVDEIGREVPETEPTDLPTA